MYNRSTYFIKKVIYNANVNRYKFQINRQKKCFMIAKRRFHSFHSFPGGPQGDGPELLLMFIMATTAYILIKKF
jgi:hypothetical protein